VDRRIGAKPRQDPFRPFAVSPIRRFAHFLVPEIPLIALLLAWQAATAPQTVVFQNVNVVPMDREHILRDHVVVVRNGFISDVAPRGRVQIPRDAVRIDGRGGYLVPGLADYHVHLRLPTDVGAYIAYGVTTLADMGGPDRVRAWRDSIRAGRAIGPEIFVGRFMDGPGGRGGVVETAEDARRATAQADSLHFDFIKVYNSLTAEQFDAIMREAKQRNMTVLGHGVRAIGLEKGFAAGQAMVVHGEEYIYTDLRGRLNDEGMASVVAFTKQHGAYVMPNLSAYNAMTEQWGKPEVLEAYLQQQEAQWMPKYWVDDWRGRDYIRRQGSTVARNEFLKQLTLAMHRAGIPMLTGTDSPGIPGMFAGASLHEELRLLVAAGLTPFEALTAATKTAGDFAATHFRSKDKFGIIAPGYRADLVLIGGDPLRDVGVLRQPVGVMVRGNWLNRDALNELLAAWKRS
jgi:hypothetical protein